MSCGFNDSTVIKNPLVEYIKVDTRPNDSIFQIESKGPYYVDNYIYNSCYEIKYKYQYEKDGDIKFSSLIGFDDWEFITRDSLDAGKGIKYIRLSAPNPNYEYNYEPQSTIKYEYLNSKNELIMTEYTGVVENYQNILIHNPREVIFKKLFSFPWPSIKFPLEKSKKWNWEWSYNAESYGDDRLFNWEGITKMKFTYEVIKYDTLKLNFGNVEVTEIEAVGSNGKIENKLRYYFNSKLGFVKQVFSTDDGAKIELEAIEFKNKCAASGG